MYQSVIEGLGNELDQQAEAIRRCGTEILKLRQGKQEAENTRDAIKKRYASAGWEGRRQHLDK